MHEDVKQRGGTAAITESISVLSRRTLLKAGGVTGVTLAISGCLSAGVAQGDDETRENDESAQIEGDESIRIPQLHLDTLEAEVQGETLQAESYEDWRSESTSYVGQVNGRRSGDLFIGVSLPGNGAEQHSEMVVYLCDGEVGAFAEIGFYMTGEYDDGGVTLTDNILSANEDSEVKLALVGGEFLGAVTLANGEQFPFIAVEAAGDAGLYWAQTDDGDMLFLWIVLPDGRQRAFVLLDELGDDLPQNSLNELGGDLPQRW
ncbi:twin-arginine translocation signal domain-containing protein [Halobaculum rarum]|uniref:twin-arginine translocation signal domain-containing protein n=1 Tax=Halobaculum rarum TaxID=3075122 RepID=UPI0032AFEB4A